MNRIARFAVIITVLQNCHPLPAPASPGPTPLVHDGQEGLWFPLDTARHMFAALNACKVQSELVLKQSQRLDVEKDRTQLLTEQVQLADQQIKELTNLTKNQGEQLHTQNAWYNSRTLWFAVGVVVTAATATTAAIAF